jgi:hypothetical protein
MKRSVCLVFAGAALPIVLHAADPQAPAGSDPVVADQELPKVLYVVPWKDAPPAPPIPPPVIQLDERLLTPLDRDAFQIQLGYPDDEAVRGGGRSNGYPDDEAVRGGGRSNGYPDDEAVRGGGGS